MQTHSGGNYSIAKIPRWYNCLAHRSQCRVLLVKLFSKHFAHLVARSNCLTANKKVREEPENLSVGRWMDGTTTGKVVLQDELLVVVVMHGESLFIVAHILPPLWYLHFAETIHVSSSFFFACKQNKRDWSRTDRSTLSPENSKQLRHPPPPPHNHCQSTSHKQCWMSSAFPWWYHPTRR